MQSNSNVEPFTDKHPRLASEVEECFLEGDRLTTVIRERLTGVSENA